MQISRLHLLLLTALVLLLARTANSGDDSVLAESDRMILNKIILEIAFFDDSHEVVDLDEIRAFEGKLKRAAEGLALPRSRRCFDRKILRPWREHCLRRLVPSAAALRVALDAEIRSTIRGMARLLQRGEVRDAVMLAGWLEKRLMDSLVRGNDPVLPARFRDLRRLAGSLLRADHQR